MSAEVEALKEIIYYNFFHSLACFPGGNILPILITMTIAHNYWFFLSKTRIPEIFKINCLKKLTSKLLQFKPPCMTWDVPADRSQSFCVKLTFEDKKRR